MDLAYRTCVLDHPKQAPIKFSCWVKPKLRRKLDLNWKEVVIHSEIPVEVDRLYWDGRIFYRQGNRSCNFIYKGDLPTAIVELKTNDEEDYLLDRMRTSVNRAKTMLVHDEVLINAL